MVRESDPHAPYMSQSETWMSKYETAQRDNVATWTELCQDTLSLPYRSRNMKTLDLPALKDAALYPEGSGRSSHSPLYEQMWNDFESLAPILNPPRRPYWRGVAQEFGKVGITDGFGNAPSSDTVRKTWWRVRRDKKKVLLTSSSRRARSRPLQDGQSPEPPPARPPVMSDFHGAPAEEGDTLGRPQFAPAKPRA